MGMCVAGTPLRPLAEPEACGSSDARSWLHCICRVACASTAVRICTNLKPSKWCCVFVTFVFLFYTLVMILVTVR